MMPDFRLVTPGERDRNPLTRPSSALYVGRTGERPPAGVLRLPGRGRALRMGVRRPSRGYLAVIRAIDRFTEVTGYLFVIVLIPLVLANVVEVFA